jgi:hypothetical protein
MFRLQEMNFGEDCVCAPVLYGGWVRDLQTAAQRLAFGKVLSERLGGSSQLAEIPALLDLVGAVGEKIVTAPSSIVAVLSMRVWT